MYAFTTRCIARPRFKSIYRTLLYMCGQQMKRLANRPAEISTFCLETWQHLYRNETSGFVFLNTWTTISYRIAFLSRWWKLLFVGVFDIFTTTLCNLLIIIPSEHILFIYCCGGNLKRSLCYTIKKHLFNHLMFFIMWNHCFVDFTSTFRNSKITNNSQWEVYILRITTSNVLYHASFDKDGNVETKICLQLKVKIWNPPNLKTS